jgi:hypothetical protein
MPAALNDFLRNPAIRSPSGPQAARRQPPRQRRLLDMHRKSWVWKRVSWISFRDHCKTPLFARFLRQAQISILEILNVFLRLKLSPSLTSNKNVLFSKVSFHFLGFLTYLSASVIKKFSMMENIL